MWLLTVVLLLLTACNDKTHHVRNNINPAGFIARFDPANSIIPFPNDLLFVGTTDGTLNIPFDPNAADAQVKTALNTLDGFSTIAPISADFSSAIDDGTLIAGSTVRLFQVNLSSIPGGAVSGIVRELGPAEYTVALSSIDTSQSKLVISPLRPLAPKTSYLVVLTTGIRSLSGQAAHAALPYALA